MVVLFGNGVGGTLKGEALGGEGEIIFVIDFVVWL